MKKKEWMTLNSIEGATALFYMDGLTFQKNEGYATFENFVQDTLSSKL